MSTKLVVLIFAAAGLLVSACSTKKAQDPAPVVYAVQARVTGQDLAGLDAAFLVTSQINVSTAQPGRGPQVLPETYANAVAKTVDIGTFDRDANIRGKISFLAVTSSPTSYRPGPTSFLKLEVLVDGRVVATTRLDETSYICNGCSDPYLAAEVFIETKRL